MRKVVLDRAICLKAGQCFYLQPSVFKADAEGWQRLLLGTWMMKHLKLLILLLRFVQVVPSKLLMSNPLL